MHLRRLAGPGESRGRDLQPCQPEQEPPDKINTQEGIFILVHIPDSRISGSWTPALLESRAKHDSGSVLPPPPFPGSCCLPGISSAVFPRGNFSTWDLPTQMNIWEFAHGFCVDSLLRDREIWEQIWEHIPAFPWPGICPGQISFPAV